MPGSAHGSVGVTLNHVSGILAASLQNELTREGGLAKREISESLRNKTGQE